jgi:hypothetical protein
VHGLYIARLLITIPIIARIIYLTQRARVFHSRVGGMIRNTDVIGMMIIYLDVRGQLMKWPVLLLMKDVFYNYYTLGMWKLDGGSDESGTCVIDAQLQTEDSFW